MKNRQILVVGILIIAFISIILLIPSIIHYLFLATVPSNPNFSISSELEPKNVIPVDVGGTDYSEIIFERSPDRWRWLVPCYGANRADDAEDGCDGFAKGYLRKYSTYTLQDGTIVKGNYTHLLSVSVPNTGYTEWYDIEYKDKAKLEGNYALLIHIIEYNTSHDARSACSFLTIDASYPKILINDVKVIGSGSHCVLPSDNFLISVRGPPHAVRDAMSKVIELYKRQ